MEMLTSVVMAASLTDWLDGMIADAKGLVVAVLAVIGLVVAILIIAKNPSIGRVITGVIVGAFIAGLPWIIPAVGEMFRGDITASGYSLIIENQAQAFLALDAPKSPAI